MIILCNYCTFANMLENFISSKILAELNFTPTDQQFGTFSNVDRQG